MSVKFLEYLVALAPVAEEVLGQVQGIKTELSSGDPEKEKVQVVLDKVEKVLVDLSGALKGS